MLEQEKEKEIKELDEWMKGILDGRELKRGIAVKLVKQGWKYRAIAEVLNVSNSFISKWKSRFEAAGLSGLKLSYKGAKSYLTSAEMSETITWLKSQEYWDLSELECYLAEKYDVVFQSPTSYYKILKLARISWQKAQKKHPRQEPEMVKKRVKEIKGILEELMPEIKAGKLVVYAVDEVHLLEGDLISHLWGSSKERLNIPMMNEKNRQTYYGALDLCKKELIIEKYEKGDGDYTRDFLKKIIKKNSGNRIMIFWDGAGYHKGEKMREFFREVNGDLPEENWVVTCHLFAPYAPEENPIEAVWLTLKNLLRRCYRFCKNFSIMKRIFELLVEFKLFNFPNLENYEAFSHLK